MSKFKNALKCLARYASRALDEIAGYCEKNQVF